MLFGHRRDLRFEVLEAKRPVDLTHHLQIKIDFPGHLLRGAEDVSVVLRHRAHARESMERARALGTMEPAEVGTTQWQLAIIPFLSAVAQGMHGPAHPAT